MAVWHLEVCDAQPHGDSGAALLVQLCFQGCPGVLKPHSLSHCSPHLGQLETKRNSFSYEQCVCGVCMHVCLSVCLCTHMYRGMEVWGWLWVSFSIALHLIFWGRVSHSVCYLRQPDHPAHSPSPPRCYPLAVITGGLPYPPGFLCGLWGSWCYFIYCVVSSDLKKINSFLPLSEHITIKDSHLPYNSAATGSPRKQLPPRSPCSKSWAERDWET